MYKYFLQFVFLMVFVQPADAQKVALIIGNSDYINESSLNSPTNDAAEVARTLRDTLGFEVDIVTDADEKSFLRSLSSFRKKTENAEVALFYFSGHGIQMDGKNYLIPTDATLNDPVIAESEMVSLRAVRQSLSGANGLKIVILDACRNNRFPDRTKGTSKGLSRIDTDAGEVVVFATRPNEVAFDGRGTLSPFTQALLEKINSNPEEEVRFLFTGLYSRVKELAGVDQRPTAMFDGMPAQQWSLAGMMTQATNTSAMRSMRSTTATCSARFFNPPVTEIVTEQIIDRPTSEEISIIPAQYETVTESVLEKEGTTTFEIVPARYETVTEEVLVQSERTKTNVVPASYETYTEQVMVRDSYVRWVYCDNAYRATIKNIEYDGDFCKVTVPAQYETVTRTRLKQIERTETSIIPAVYEIITREVVAVPAQVVERKTPSLYQTMTKELEITPARIETITIPPTYKTIERTVVVSGGDMIDGLRLCQNQITPGMIFDLQSNLRNKTDSTSIPVDGVYGQTTRAALHEYQEKNGLLIGDWSLQTLYALDVLQEPVNGR